MFRADRNRSLHNGQNPDQCARKPQNLVDEIKQAISLLRRHL